MMGIIISPAKKMVVDTDSFAVDGLPVFLKQTERLSAMDLRQRLTPAVISYEGIQYQYMAPGVMETARLDYLREHLRILSGFCGLLRPLDGVTPYRLEMQARPQRPANGWGPSIADRVEDETHRRSRWWMVPPQKFFHIPLIPGQPRR